MIHIDLSSNDIQAEGACHLFDALLENSSIISVDLGSKEGLNRNRIGEVGTKSL